jgi:hypothetical protein
MLHYQLSSLDLNENQYNFTQLTSVINRRQLLPILDVK